MPVLLIAAAAVGRDRYAEGNQFRVLVDGFGARLTRDLRCLRGQLARDLDLARAVRRAVALEQIVEPQRRFLQRIRSLPAVPRQARLDLADEPPVHHRYVLAPYDR